MSMTMSSSVQALLKPSSMAATNTCFMSLPSYSYHPHLSLISSKPYKLNISCTYSPSPLFSLKKKNTHFRTMVSVVSAPEEENFESNGEAEFQEPSEDAKVFVGNLPYDIDSEKLAHMFEKSGVVEIAEVIYNRETNQSRGFGFVTMSTVEEAEKAVEMYSNYDMDGRILTVNKAAPRGSRPERTPRVYEPSHRIYIGNLPWDVDDSQLMQLFSEHGKVINARVVYDRETNRSRGFGFVTMSSESELNDAIANLDGQTVDGRTVRVNAAEGRPQRN